LSKFSAELTDGSNSELLNVGADDFAAYASIVSR
jgi:hypothetical protein